MMDVTNLLTGAVDELREEIGRGHCNASAGDFLTSSQFRLTSMPIDPTAENWQLNRVDEATVEQLRRELTETDTASASQARLFRDNG